MRVGVGSDARYAHNRPHKRAARLHTPRSGCKAVAERSDKRVEQQHPRADIWDAGGGRRCQRRAQARELGGRDAALAVVAAREPHQQLVDARRRGAVHKRRELVWQAPHAQTRRSVELGDVADQAIGQAHGDAVDHDVLGAGAADEAGRRLMNHPQRSERLEHDVDLLADDRAVRIVIHAHHLRPRVHGQVVGRVRVDELPQEVLLQHPRGVVDKVAVLQAVVVEDAAAARLTAVALVHVDSHQAMKRDEHRAGADRRADEHGVSPPRAALVAHDLAHARQRGSVAARARDRGDELDLVFQAATARLDARRAACPRPRPRLAPVFDRDAGCRRRAQQVEQLPNILPRGRIRTLAQGSFHMPHGDRM